MYLGDLENRGVTILNVATSSGKRPHIADRQLPNADWVPATTALD